MTGYTWACHGCKRKFNARIDFLEHEPCMRSPVSEIASRPFRLRLLYMLRFGWSEFMARPMAWLGDFTENAYGYQRNRELRKQTKK